MIIRQEKKKKRTEKKHGEQIYSQSLKERPNYEGGPEYQVSSNFLTTKNLMSILIKDSRNKLSLSRLVQVFMVGVFF